MPGQINQIGHHLNEFLPNLITVKSVELGGQIGWKSFEMMPGQIGRKSIEIMPGRIS